MTIHIRNLTWLDHNGQRNYPLAVEATRQDTTGTFEIPQDFIVGMYLGVHFGLNVDPGKFFIRSVSNFASGFGIVVAYNATGGAVDVATANIARAAFATGQTYRLTGLGDFIDATGQIQLGSLDNIDQQPGGQFSFAVAGALLESDVVRPVVRGISGLRISSNGIISERIAGDVILTGGTNVRLTLIQLAGQNPQIVIDAIEGEGLNEECVCEDDPTTAPCIRTLNGVPPTTDGDFTILGNDCLVPVPITNGLRLDDKCSEPCCGCTELETVTAQLEQFARQATTLENFLVSLEARVTTMDNVVLGSRLGDRSCLTCA